MSEDKEFEKQILSAFENIRASEKEMDDLNEKELHEARKAIKEIRESKNVFLNEWINTDLRRFGRLTKHDLLRIFIAYRVTEMIQDLEYKMKGGKNEECTN